MNEFRVGLSAGRIEEAATFESALLMLFIERGTENLCAVRLIKIDSRWTGVEFERDGSWAGIIYCPAAFAADRFPGEPLFDVYSGAKVKV